LRQALVVRLTIGLGKYDDEDITIRATILGMSCAMPLDRNIAALVVLVVGCNEDHLPPTRQLARGDDGINAGG